MIPLTTTTVTVKGKRPQSSIDPDAEGYDAPAADPVTLATGVKASITLPEGKRRGDQGAQAGADETLTYKLRMDVIAPGLTRYDVVIDEVSGVEFEVVTSQQSLPLAFGLEHIKATLVQRKGVSANEPS